MEPAKTVKMFPVPPIPNGYYLKARKIEESEIAHAAPCIRETWDWLLRNCNHKDNPAMGLKRGQCVRTLADIAEGLHWFVGYRKMTYTKTQCENALEYLRKKQMITTAKTTRGMVITVCKYDYYNNPKNYEGNSEGDKKTTGRQQQGDTINKNGNNENDLVEPVGSEAQGENPVEPPPADPKPPTLYKQCVALYFTFFQERNDNVPPQFTGKHGEHMKSIITYLKTVVKAKQPNITKEAIEGEVLKSLKHIFDNWDSLSDFTRQQTDICAMNSQMNRIITELKAKKQPKQDTNEYIEQRKKDAEKLARQLAS